MKRALMIVMVAVMGAMQQASAPPASQPSADAPPDVNKIPVKELRAKYLDQCHDLKALHEERDQLMQRMRAVGIDPNSQLALILDVKQPVSLGNTPVVEVEMIGGIRLGTKYERHIWRVVVKVKNVAPYTLTKLSLMARVAGEDLGFSSYTPEFDLRSDFHDYWTMLLELENDDDIGDRMKIEVVTAQSAE